MRVAYFTALREIEIREEPQPSIEKPDDVLLQINRVGVCGSDVHYYAHGCIGDQLVEYPATLGHECAGTVVEVGSAVKHLSPGTRVAVDPAISCGHCDQCKKGREHTCRNLQFMGCPKEAPGAVADYRVVPGRCCAAVSDSVSLDMATLIEPLTIGYYAVQLAKLKEGAKVGILGTGPIGLSVLLCAKAAVSCTTYATDLLDCRLDVAKACGADWTGNPNSEDVEAAIADEEPLALDVVLECSGDPACVDSAQRMLTPGGMLVMVGIPPVTDVSFNSHVMRRKELVHQAVRRQNACVEPTVRLMEEGRIDPSPMLTHHFPLEKITEAFELVADYRDGVVKALIEM